MRNRGDVSLNADVCTFSAALQNVFHASQDLQEDCIHFISPQIQCGAEEGETQVNCMTEPY